MIKSTRTTRHLAALGLSAIVLSLSACGGGENAEPVTNDDTVVILDAEAAPAAESSGNREAPAANSNDSTRTGDEVAEVPQADSTPSASEQSAVAVAEAPAEEPVAQPEAEMPTEEYADETAEEYIDEIAEAQAEMPAEEYIEEAADAPTEYEDEAEVEMIAEPIAPDDGGDAVTSNDQHRLIVKPNQAATGTEAVSYRDGVGDRGDRWSIKASNDFFDSVTKSTTMIIQIVCPEGGIWVHQGAVRDGYAPKSAAGAQECSGAVTLTEFVGYQSSDVGFTVYLPDGVAGYFPYTVVASAA
ncbi:MAG: hypothetical protein ISQ15_10045 [Ilumatobacteraceae bacterium]|nr:hypothetical protein [Ilumatobacteraceae bacterium]